MDDFLIRLEKVTIGYNGKGLIGPLELSIKRNQFWGIVGPNGGGKTTLLKTILGLIPPVRGEVRYGESGSLVFGYVPQSGNFDHLFPLSVAEFVAMGRYCRIPVGVGIERRDWEVVIRYLKKTGILHLRNRPFRSISGGERQRALVARALSGEPDVLILDEPTASVDVRGEAEIMGLLEEIRESRAITVLIVSHFLHTIARFADHVIFIDKDRGAFLTGKKEEVLTDSVLGDVFGLDATIKSRV